MGYIILRDGCRWLIAVIVSICLLLFVRRKVECISGQQQIFPNDLMDNMQNMNAWRVNQSRQFLNSLSRNWSMQETDNADVRIGIVAVKRKGDFLLQTVASLLNSTSSNRLLRTNIFICDVSAVLNQDIQFLNLYVPIIHSNRSSPIGIDSGYATNIVKELNDYAFCLQHYHNERYFLLVEDDVVAVPKFISLLSSLIKQMDLKPDIHYVKLFHPIHLRGIPYYFQTTAASILIAANLSYLLQFHFKFIAGLMLTGFLIYHIHIHYTFQLFVDIRYALTKSAYLTTSESCCTPAVLYRTSKINEIIKYLNQFKNSSQPKDILLDNSPFRSRMTDTNVVLHIGYFSSIRNSYVVLDVIRHYNQQFRHVFPF